MYRYQPPLMGVGKATDIGKKRKENQDAMAYLELDKSFLAGARVLIVADGMGGALGGQLAAETAVATIEEYFKGEDISPEPDIAIREAIEKAASEVYKKASSDPELAGMGTTCLVAIVHNGYLFAGHVGDSRLYLWRNGKLYRLTRDHSRVQFLVEAGILNEEEAINHPHQNFLARVLGSQEKPNIELLAPPRKLKEGDRILLCSDGLYNEVPEGEIEKLLGEVTTSNAQEIAEKLVSLANENGGNDNITVQILAYGEIQPRRVRESFFPFRSSLASLSFLALVILAFFLLGFFIGRSYSGTDRDEIRSQNNEYKLPSTLPSDD